MTSEFMRRAIAVAETMAGKTSPNPNVGCVLVRDGAVIAEGVYGGEGTPHAEIAALRAAGGTARGAVAFVTLEPCSHRVSSITGQPRVPCCDALIAAGIARVVFAIQDPDERTNGRGARALRDAGIAVEQGDGALEAGKLHEAFLKHRRTGLPFIIVKYAATLDGRLAAGSGDSRWVSGPETLKWAHRERMKLDAIIVGSQNVIADDPQLTARPDGVQSGHRLLRMVADSTGRISATARVLDGAAKTLIVTTERSPEAWRESIRATGHELLVLPADATGRVPLAQMLQELGRRGVLTLQVEGGGVLHGSFFDQRLVDKCTIVIAPKIVGAAAAAQAVSGIGAQYMREAVSLRDLTVERLGDDVLFTGYPVWPESTT
jgi:diaminohydroxyphosphoribosylaminopyrimidine deaminase/5-amino-6-(5-phosphoribosylamino)uracil reductase